MSLAYRFSNLCGSVYKCANVVFTPDGNSLLSPVGNRITVFDLVDHSSYTLPCENRTNIARIAVSPIGHLVLSIDQDGRALVINFKRRIVVHRFNFKHPIKDAKFSADGKLLAIAHGRKLQIWKAPSLHRNFAPFELMQTLTGHYDDIVCVNWSDDGMYMITGSADMSARIYTTYPTKDYIPITLSGHRDAVIGAYFGDKDLVYTVSKDGAVFSWRWKERAELSARAAAKLLRELQAGDSSSEESSNEEETESEDSDSNNSASGDSSDSDDESISHKSDNVLDTLDDVEDTTKSTKSVGVVKGAGAAHATKPLASRRKHAVRAPHSELVSEQTRKALTEVFGGLSTVQFGAENAGQSHEEATEQLIMSVVRGSWSLENKHFFNMDHARVQSAEFHRGASLLIVGFDTGVFGIYTMPDVNPIHTLSISQQRIDTAAINASGEWLAFGSAAHGQLLVWEWQTESYILKQQGHNYDMTCLAYSPDGQIIATGADDGKIKLWNTHTGFCFVTFSDHTAPISALKFMGGRGGRGQAILSASLDGTVRAYDLVRYRNFRTLTTPDPVQLISLATDASGEIVCAGALEPYEVYVWNLQTSSLLDVLAGHAGPVCSLDFSPATSLLASASWDRSVRLWDVYGARRSDTNQDGTTGGKGKGAATEVFEHSSDVLAVAFRPDGAQLCSSTRDGQLHFWDAKTGRSVGTIQGKHDAAGGRSSNDARTAKNSTKGKHFSSLAYTADGTCVLAGGRTRYVCLYAIEPKLLLRKFQISHNRSLDGIVDKLRSDQLGEHGGSMSALDLDKPLADQERRRREDTDLPGVFRGEATKRNTPPEIRSRCLRFAPTGRSFAVATTEGLLIFSIDEQASFDPFHLDEDVTPEHIQHASNHGEHAKAMIMALHLNEQKFIVAALNAVPLLQIAAVVRSIPIVFLKPLVEILADQLRSSSHIEYHMQWALIVIQTHGIVLRNRTDMFIGAMRELQKSVLLHRNRIASILDSNEYTLSFVCDSASARDPLEASNNNADITNDDASDEALSQSGSDNESDSDSNSEAEDSKMPFQTIKFINDSDSEDEVAELLHGKRQRKQ